MRATSAAPSGSAATRPTVTADRFQPAALAAGNGVATVDGADVSCAVVVAIAKGDSDVNGTLQMVWVATFGEPGAVTSVATPPELKCSRRVPEATAASVMHTTTWP